MHSSRYLIPFRGIKLLMMLGFEAQDKSGSTMDLTNLDPVSSSHCIFMLKVFWFWPSTCTCSCLIIGTSPCSMRRLSHV